MADYEFRYAPLTGRLTGKQMIEQTEQAINGLANLVDDAAGQVEIISTLANEANENAATALETAEEALATTGRTYITVSIPADANDYYDSQLIYIADNTSTNIPVADTGMLEVKTNDNKTSCEQVFIADSSGACYFRNGAITAETVGDVTTYTVTWGGWSSEPASQAYVQNEISGYLPLSGGTVTGNLTIDGTLTGIASGNLPLSGGTMTGNLSITPSENYPLIYTNSDVKRLSIASGSNIDNKGASISLYGQSYSYGGSSDGAGQFMVRACMGSTHKDFVGKPDGTLTWNGKTIPTKDVNIQTGSKGSISVSANSNATTTISFSPAFASTPIVVATPATGYVGMSAQVSAITTSGCTITINNASSTARTITCNWVAISL